MEDKICTKCGARDTLFDYCGELICIDCFTEEQLLTEDALSKEE